MDDMPRFDDIKAEDIAKNILPALMAFARVYDYIHEKMLPKIQALREAAEKAIEKHKSAMPVLSDGISETGWTCPPHWGLFDFIDLADVPPQQWDTIFLTYYSDEGAFDETIRGISDSLNNETHKTILKECVAAYANGLYYVCAISLMPMIEGMISRISDNIDETRVIHPCKKQAERLCESQGELSYTYLFWMSISKFLESLYSFRKFSAEEPNLLNRH